MTSGYKSKRKKKIRQQRFQKVFGEIFICRFDYIILLVIYLREVSEVE